MENLYKYPISLNFDEEYVIKCYIDDEDALLKNDADYSDAIRRIKNEEFKDFFIDLTLNTVVGAKKVTKLSDLLESCYNRNGNVDIYTSGRNVGLCLSLLPQGADNFNIFIDDYEPREVLKTIPVEKINFNCHLSEKYLLNLDESLFNYVCQQENFKFDRDDISRKRASIRAFWKSRVGDLRYVDKFSEEEKITMVLDYIDENIAYIDNADNNSPLQIIKDGQCDSKGMAKLSSFLLDNYLSKVDCHEVTGKHSVSNFYLSWIVTKISGQKYGHCLITNKRFKKLPNYGYVDGKISLEPTHFSRREYMAEVDDYSEMGDSQYLYLRYCLDDKVSSFYQANNTSNGSRPYVKVKNTSIN